jgi:hypothetical protein
MVFSTIRASVPRWTSFFPFEGFIGDIWLTNIRGNFPLGKQQVMRELSLVTIPPIGYIEGRADEFGQHIHCNCWELDPKGSVLKRTHS